MKWKRIYNLYNTKKLKSNKILYVFIIIAVIISVSISLSIPQVISGTNTYLSKLSKDINGADLKIIETFTSQEFNSEVQVLRDKGLDIKESNVYSISINYQSNRLFCQLLVGDYDLEPGEIILYTDIAKKLNLSINDEIEFNNQSYRIDGIEDQALGVDTTSEMFGYCKVSAYDSTNNLSNAKILYINGDIIEEVKDTLSEIEPKFIYTTIDDQETILNEKLNMNIMALSTLNTMSFIMAIVSVLSSIIMIILDRQQDIAIMRMVSINSKTIMKSFRFELKTIVVIPLIIGSIASVPIANYLLGLKNVSRNSNSFMDVFAGFLLFAIIYFVFINIATKVILIINPLSIIKNEKVPMNKSMIKITIQSMLFTIISMFLYMFYIGWGSSMVSGLAIVFIILLFFAVILLLIKFIFVFKIRNTTINYTFKSIRCNSVSFALTVLSIALTSWFILFGFSMERTIIESYNSSLEDKISYNYMLVSDDILAAEDELHSNKEVEGYTVVSREIGTLLSDSETDMVNVILGTISEDKYAQKYQILNGDDIFEGGESGILLSDKLSKDINKTLGDSIRIGFNNAVSSFKIKGIYESGGINDNYILKAASPQDTEEKKLFLVKSSSDEFAHNLKDSSIINVDIMGTTLLKSIRDFLLVFKYLCIICVIASILFNFNMIYMNYINGYKENAMIRALGIGKSFLYKSMLIKYISSLIISFIIVIGLYVIIIKAALNAILNSELTLTASDFVYPLLCIILVLLAYYLFSFYWIKKSKGFDALREQV